jgi:hypothetical protein
VKTDFEKVLTSDSTLGGSPFQIGIGTIALLGLLSPYQPAPAYLRNSIHLSANFSFGVTSSRREEHRSKGEAPQKRKPWNLPTITTNGPAITQQMIDDALDDY